MIKVGDVVRHRHQSGPSMTVERVHQADADCVWFEDNRQVRGGSFPLTSLELVGSPVPADPVNPNHYKDLGEYSPIHVIERWALGFHLGQVLKYIGRAGKKPGEPVLQDLKKARWYLDRFIEQQEKRS